MNEMIVGELHTTSEFEHQARADRMAWIGSALLLLALMVGIFLGAALFPRVVEVPVEIEKRVTVRDDKAIADAKKHIAVLKQSVTILQGQVDLLKARQVRADTVPTQPITLSPSAKGLESDALEILSEFGVKAVQVKECR